MQLSVLTIVLNGMPFLLRHHEQFKKLSIPWRWSIVHGIADPVADTKWCRALDRVQDDGTAKYLKELAQDSRITVTAAERWPGKTVMCNAALDRLDQPGVLLQVDADECWTAAQLETIVRLFDAYPSCDCAFFFCRCFFGPKRVVTQPGGYGNRMEIEWLRAWRWDGRRKFLSHEPPRLAGQTTAIPHTVTACAGCVFDHYAYAAEEQVAFKERYYGRPGMTAEWRKLNAQHGPQNLRAFLSFVPQDVVSYEIP